MNLKLIYDFGDRWPNVGVMLLPLGFVLVGLGIFFYHLIAVKNTQHSRSLLNRRNYGMFFGILFASLTGLIALVLIPANINEYQKTKRIYDSRDYEIVQGTVENYHPMPATGHDRESFTVKGVSFEFSDYDVSDYGYNNAASKGGAIKEGLYVRIAYFNNGNRNVILRLEVDDH